jgi:tight adherence protein B
MSPTLITLVVALLGFVAIAGFGWAVAGGETSSAKALKRAQGLVVNRGEASEANRVRRAQAAPDQRRRQILKTLREQEKQQKRARLTLSSRLQQAGLSGNVRGFWIASSVLSLVVALMIIALRQPWWAALLLSAAAGLGLPRWVVGFLAKQRMKKFTAAFPDAMDIIVRGIRSGLPVHDCLRVIAKETSEPLAGEFRRLVENLGVGLSVDQALERMFESMPSAEVRFFSIVLAIQSKSGGNLAEALNNLSTVIRARKMMREKIKAMAGEAVASACIIGALPPGVVALISVTSPSYMVPLFTDPRGNLLLLGGGLWMAMGIFVMRRMINFKI